jgi:hypothetical protein
MCAGHDEDGVILLILSKGMSDINEAIGRAYKSRRNPYRDSTGATSESTTESTNTPIYQGPPTNFNTRKRNRNARINAQLDNSNKCTTICTSQDFRVYTKQEKYRNQHLPHCLIDYLEREQVERLGDVVKI